MSGDIWEQMVERYLTKDRGVFLNPEYLVGEPNKWEGWADFLALEFRNKRAWMVEVSTEPRRKIFIKIAEFESLYAPRIKEQLVQHGVITIEDWSEGWTVGIWVFVPKGRVRSTKTRILDAAVKISEITPFEDIWPEDQYYGTRFR